MREVRVLVLCHFEAELLSLELVCQTRVSGNIEKGR